MIYRVGKREQSWTQRSNLGILWSVLSPVQKSVTVARFVFGAIAFVISMAAIIIATLLTH